jgi:Carbohydrate family 9 binding domain-like
MIGILLLVCALPVSAAGKGLGPMDPGVPTYVCRRATEAIVIDGKLDEPSWQKAEPTRAFVFPWPGQPGDKQRTVAQLVWDDDALYVAYTCSDGDITATFEARDDPVYKDDCVEIFINPAPAKSRFYYGFEMNARGVMYDYFNAWPTCLVSQFDLPGYELATTLEGTLNDSSDHDTRWCLEVKIPFAGLGGLAPKFPPDEGVRWRIQMNRWDGTEKRALSEWTPSGKKVPDPHRPAGFGVLEFTADQVGE